MSDGSSADPSAIHASILDEVRRVFVGDETVVTHLTIAMLTRGHVLLEGVPGVAKTTLANLFAGVIGLEYSRIQMTPDILPADITGSTVYHEPTGDFNLRRGPIFANVVVADEINRATPKTQSALLEAMQEQQVTIEGETLDLPKPFMVIATQNPLEFEGVFELPEAQRDRFQLKLSMGIPARRFERELLARFDENPTLSPSDVEQVVSPADIHDAREIVTAVHVAEPISEYLLDLVEATRTHPDVEHGASPRATIAFQNVAKARAAIIGREYVIPDDLKALANVALRHRLVLTTDAELSGVAPDEIIDDILSAVETPGADPEQLAGAER